MAEEKKPKIDLKARLGKTAVGTPSPLAGGIPAPLTSGNIAPPSGPSSSPSPRIPVPLGVPVGPPPGYGKTTPGAAIDPTNPLAAAVAPPVRTAPPPPPQPQRIEVDEAGVQEARKGARKQGLLGGLVVAIVLGALGYIIGTSTETSKARQASVNHAKSLATDVDKAKAQLVKIGDLVDAGRNTLAKDHKFPDNLAHDLGALNVDFDGTKLAGVRFSGFSQETTSGLIEFITSVQALNDRKAALASLLSKLQKPITEQLKGGGKQTISYVVIVDKDPQRNEFAILAPLTKGIDVDGQAAPTLPDTFTATNPLTHGNVTIPKLATLDKGGAAYVIPRSVEAACPSETAGQIQQLGGQLTRLVNDVRGEPAQEAMDPKPGLVDRADKLETQLNKVQ